MSINPAQQEVELPPRDQLRTSTSTTCTWPSNATAQPTVPDPEERATSTHARNATALGAGITTHLGHPQLGDKDFAPSLTKPTSSSWPILLQPGNETSQDGNPSARTDAPSPIDHHPKSPPHSGLRVQTDLAPKFMVTSVAQDQLAITPTNRRYSGSPSALRPRSSSNRLTLSPSGTPTIGSPSPSSAWSSPALSAVADVTPLPSPIAPGSSPGPWNRMAAQLDATESDVSASRRRSESASTSSPLAPSRKRAPYNGLVSAAGETKQANLASHARNRSVSEFVPEPVHTPRARLSTVSGSGGPSGLGVCLKREEYLAEQRGLAAPATGLPTPPRSDRGTESSDSDASPALRGYGSAILAKTGGQEIFHATRLRDGTPWRWRAVRLLGQGTFSKVILAVSEGLEGGRRSMDENWSLRNCKPPNDATTDSKQLVAVKVVEHGPAGGASEERVESSLKRELDILKSMHHPSIVHLKAYSIEPSRALLILRYCPGGDLFDVASQKHHLLKPPLIRRIFAELVAATRYLHAQFIVHRDIKLENVLLNIPSDQLAQIPDWQTHPYSVVTLTDLGLSRRIDPADPKLHTRCGSEDYASPELLMGQAYDGRQTDAWALGVLLYALMEGHLPFDPPPGASEQQRLRNRTVHRIARCEWSWYKFANEDGEPGDFGELSGARLIVEGLLKRASRRVSLDQVAEEGWVKGGVQVEGGLLVEDDGDD